jgi:hypothetical protein
MNDKAQEAFQRYVETEKNISLMQNTEKTSEMMRELIDWINYHNRAEMIDVTQVKINFGQLLSGFPTEAIAEALMSRMPEKQDQDQDQVSELEWSEVTDEPVALCKCRHMPVIHCEVDDFNHPEDSKIFYAECKTCGILVNGNSETDAAQKWNLKLKGEMKDDQTSGYGDLQGVCGKIESEASFTESGDQGDGTAKG